MAGDTRGARLGLLGVIALVMIAVLGTRLWFLQVVDADSIQARVEATRTKEVDLPPERGRIFDAEGRILADNERVLTVIVDQDVIRNRPQSRKVLFERLAGPLKTSWTEIEIRYCGEDPENPTQPDEKCNGGLFNAYLPFPAADDIDEATALYLRERTEDFPGVDVQEGWRRKYLYAPTASQIVGYLGRIPGDNPRTAGVNETQEYIDRGYSLNDLVGVAGIELQFEKDLRGTPGHATFEVDAAGNVLKTVNRTEPVPGKDIQLTIDLKLQLFAEQTLETELRRARSVSPYPEDDRLGRNLISFYRAPAGSVVVEKHITGEIVAMASYPTFDNRWFSAGVSERKFQQLFPTASRTDPDLHPSPLVNRAIQGRYNSGSTFKPFTAYAALHTGFIGPDFIYTDEGRYDIPFCDKKQFKCTFKNAHNFVLNEPTRYGPINVSQALAISSDTFFYRIGAELFLRDTSVPTLQNEFKLFGFGERSGIDLPYEYKGIVPDKEAKKRLAEQKAITQKEGTGFFVGDSVLMAIGQGLNAVTPLQLTNAYATMANGGYLLKPLIVRAIFPPGVPDSLTQVGYVDLEAVEPELRYTTEVRATIDPTPLGPIVNGLVCVVKFNVDDCPFVNGKQPTGQKPFQGWSHDRIPIAGKTGTAQGKENLPENDSSVFVGFQLDPSGYTVGAYLEKAGYGKRAAAPVVRCLMAAVNGAYENMDEPQLADELNINATTPAPIQLLKDQQCLDDATEKGRTDRRER